MCPFASALTSRRISWRLAVESTAAVHGRRMEDSTHLMLTLVILGVRAGAMGLALRTVVVVEALGCSHGGGRRKRPVREVPSNFPRLASLIGLIRHRRRFDMCLLMQTSR